jgi:hypothetical protein
MGSSRSNGDGYEFVVGKRLGSRSARGFEGFELIEIPDDGMLLRGVVEDQAALHGVLAQIRDLGIPLLAVRRVHVDQSPGRHADPEGVEPASDPFPGARVSDESD